MAAISSGATVDCAMRLTKKLSEPASLQVATEMVCEYAETCVAGSASIPDCNSFRGHIHAATVTKEEFKWIRKPKNLQT
jgi:hypothetical protein